VDAKRIDGQPQAAVVDGWLRTRGPFNLPSALPGEEVCQGEGHERFGRRSRQVGGELEYRETSP